MATQGPNITGTGANDASVGTNAWSNPTNITVNDDTFAAVTGTFDAGPDILQNAVRIVKADGSIGTTNKSTGSALPSTVFSNITFGGPADLWGETWTATDINDADFGAVFQTIRTGSVTSNYLKGTNFGFSIPAGATIDGIQLDIRMRQLFADSTTGTGNVAWFKITVTYTAAATTGFNIALV